MIRLTAILAALCFALPLAADGLGDDGLYKSAWMRDTFKDLPEDLAEANAEGKRLMLIFEQRGCIYCKEMHEKVFSKPQVAQFIADNYFVVQLNLHGATDVTDFDGDVLSERDMARKWGLLFTPTMLFLPQDVGNVSAPRAAVAMMPGAFGSGTVMDMFTWVVEERYLKADVEDFQRYHARRIQERDNGKTD